MSELKMGDRVRILNGGECKVLAKLGEGGQGIVYKVSYEGKEMALKWYFIEKMKIQSNSTAICKEILNKELQQILFFGHKN